MGGCGGGCSRKKGGGGGGVRLSGEEDYTPELWAFGFGLEGNLNRKCHEEAPNLEMAMRCVKLLSGMGRRSIGIWICDYVHET